VTFQLDALCPIEKSKPVFFIFPTLMMGGDAIPAVPGVCGS
jgi:hypothetical protein